MWQYVRLWSAQAVYATCSDCFRILSMAKGPFKDWNTLDSIVYTYYTGWLWHTMNHSPTSSIQSNALCGDSWILSKKHVLFLVVSFHVICTSIPFVSSKMMQTELKPLLFPYLFPLKILDCSIPLGQFGGKLTTRSTPMSWEIPGSGDKRPPHETFPSMGTCW